MVKNHYRWDFIGLSTDEKPTPATSEKVTDGSTFYVSDTSKLYVWCKDNWYEKTVSGGGGGGTSNFNQLSNRPKYNGVEMTGSTDIPEVKTYTAGTNVTITGNEISATDTTYSAFTGTDGVDAGTSGLVPAPATTDAGKFLKADGTWDTAGGSSVNVVQTTGTSTTDVMSQDATTGLIYNDKSTRKEVRIQSTSYDSNSRIRVGFNNDANGIGSIAIGFNAQAGSSSNHANALAIGGGDYSSTQPKVTAMNGVAIGSGSRATVQGQFSIGGYLYSKGYNNTNYRLLSGLHDGQTDHDAVTVAQVNATIDAINTALSTNIPHIGASS